MKTAILRAFCPTDGNNLVFGDQNERIRFAGPDPVYDVHGCSKSLKLHYRGEDFYASVISVNAGSETTLIRGEGQRTHKQTFTKDGVVVDVVMPASSPALRAVRQLRSRGLGLRLNFEPLTGCERTEQGASVFHCTTAAVRSISLATGNDADCEISIIE